MFLEVHYYASISRLAEDVAIALLTRFRLVNILEAVGLISCKMFNKNEIKRLAMLFDNIEDIQLDSFLEPEDIATIEYEANTLYNKTKKLSGRPQAYINLKNRVVSPKNTNRHCTVVVQRLHNDYDFGEWVSKVANTVIFSENTEFAIGFSFLSWIPHTNERTYLFSAKALAPFKFVTDSRAELMPQLSEVMTMSDESILDKTFLNTASDNPFTSSGFCPLKIVSSYIYITK